MIPPKKSRKLGTECTRGVPLDFELYGFEFLDCWRGTNAEGKRYQVLLGRDWFQPDGRNPNERPLRKGGNRFKRS